MTSERGEPPVQLPRAERAAAALRENLRKRKAQQRAREAEAKECATAAGKPPGTQQTES